MRNHLRIFITSFLLSLLFLGSPSQAKKNSPSARPNPQLKKKLKPSTTPRRFKQTFIKKARPLPAVKQNLHPQPPTERELPRASLDTASLLRLYSSLLEPVRVVSTLPESIPSLALRIGSGIWISAISDVPFYFGKVMIYDSKQEKKQIIAFNVASGFMLLQNSGTNEVELKQLSLKMNRDRLNLGDSIYALSKSPEGKMLLATGTITGAPVQKSNRSEFEVKLTKPIDGSMLVFLNLKGEFIGIQTGFTAKKSKTNSFQVTYSSTIVELFQKAKIRGWNAIVEPEKHLIRAINEFNSNLTIGRRFDMWSGCRHYQPIISELKPDTQISSAIDCELESGLNIDPVISFGRARLVRASLNSQSGFDSASRAILTRKLTEEFRKRVEPNFQENISRVNYPICTQKWLLLPSLGDRSSRASHYSHTCVGLIRGYAGLGSTLSILENRKDKKKHMVTAVFLEGFSADSTKRILNAILEKGASPQ